MAERKPLSKQTRFEVFKRDKFTCQYCGKQAPDVILEVDHIKPVAEGGDNDMLNLVTACFDCNRGKGKRTLSDDSVVVKQRAALNEAQERFEQLEMMGEWKKSLSLLVEEQVDMIESVMQDWFDNSFTEYGRKDIKRLIGRFGFNLVYESAEIAFSTYDDCGYALKKLGGVCYNIKYRRGGDSHGA